jgi:hypothetical protein
MNKAHNLEQAIANLDPGTPLKPEDKDFFVERDHSQRQLMGQRLQLLLNTPGQYARFLFTGHRGSGKGTELYRLNKELEASFSIAHYSVLDDLEVSDLEYTDVVFSIGMSIVKLATENPEASKSIPRRLLDPIIEFFSEIYSENEYKEKYDSGLEIKPTLLNILSGFARFGTERSSRKIVRKKLSVSLQNLMTAIDDLARQIERTLNKKILVIVEDFDKAADLKKARELFFEHGKSLSDPKVHLVYTFPVALRHSLEFNQIKTYFRSFDLPNIKTHSRDDQPEQAGLDKLKEIVTLRVAENLFEPGTLELLTEKSGGLVRSLIALTNDACLQAILDKRLKVNLNDAKTAIGDERASYARFLTPDQLDALRAIKNSKTINNTKEHQDLLFNLSVLEYRNGDPSPWYDVHPIVQDLL